MPVYLLLLALITYIPLWTNILRRASADIDEHHPAVTLSLCVSVFLFSSVCLMGAIYCFSFFLSLSAPFSYKSVFPLFRLDANMFLCFKILFCQCCGGQCTTALHSFINKNCIIN